MLEDSGARLLIRASPTTHPDVGIAEFEAGEFDGPPPDGAGVTGVGAGVRRRRDPRVHVRHDRFTEGRHPFAREPAVGRDPDGGGVRHRAARTSRSRPRRSRAWAGSGSPVLPTLFAGGAVVVPPAADGASVLSTIERARVTVVFANPDLLQDMVRTPGWNDADLSSVRTGVVGGGLVPEPLLRTYLDRGVPLLHGYGLTEAAPIVSLLGNGTPQHARDRWAGRVHSSRSVRSARTARSAGRARWVSGGSADPTCRRATGTAHPSATRTGGSRPATLG